MANKVLRADASSLDASIEVDLGIDQSEVWVTLGLAYSTATLIAPLNGVFLRLWNAAHDTIADQADTGNDGAQYWETFTAFDYVPAPVAEIYQTVEVHLINGGATNLYVDGTLVGSGIDGIGVDVRFVNIGFMLNAPADPTNVFFIDNFKTGTTRGGSDLASDDFESGDLSAWTSTEGDVSVVEDPFEPAPTPSFSGVYLVDFVDKDTLVVSETVHPENLEFVLHDGREPHTISFDLSFSSKNTDGDDAVLRPVGPDFVPFIGPYRSGWILRYVSENYGIDWQIASGVITSTHARSDDDAMSISGKSWLHILEKTQMPFNPAAPNDFRFSGSVGVTDFDPPFDVMYHVANQDIADIVLDIMEAVFTGVDPQQYRDSIGYNYVLTGKLINYRIPLASTTNLLQMLLEFADTYPGFDIEMDDAIQTFSIVEPFGGVGTDTLASDDTASVYKFDADHEGVEIEFTNDGPDWTHLLGVANGLQTHYGRALGDEDNQIEFGRLDDNVDFGDVNDQDRVNDMTRKEFVIGLHPVHKIELVVDVEVLQNNDVDTFSAEPGGFWSLIRPNVPIWTYHDFWYHILNSAQKVITMTCKVSNEGDCEVTFGLNQIYDTTVHAGDVQG